MTYINDDVHIEITAGNDDYHQQENDISEHIFGKALDFTISPYNDQTRTIIEDILSEPGNGVSFINEYESPSPNTTGPHFHFQLI